MASDTVIMLVAYYLLLKISVVGDLKNIKSQFLVPQDSVAGMLPEMSKWTLNQ